MFKELFENQSEFSEIYKAHQKLQLANKKLDTCYGDNGTTYTFGKELGGKKGACTRASNKLFKEIEKVFGKDKMGVIAIKVLTALQDGTDLAQIKKI